MDLDDFEFININRYHFNIMFILIGEHSGISHVNIKLYAEFSSIMEYVYGKRKGVGDFVRP